MLQPVASVGQKRSPNSKYLLLFLNYYFDLRLHVIMKCFCQYYDQSMITHLFSFQHLPNSYEELSKRPTR